MEAPSASSFDWNWVIGYEVEHDVGKISYWRRLLNRELRRAIALRDFRTLSCLVKRIVFLKDRNWKEKLITSESSNILFCGLVQALPNDILLQPIFNQYLNKIPVRIKTEITRSVVANIIMDSGFISDYETLKDVIQNSQKFKITTRPDFDIYMDIKTEPKELVAAFRVDPTAKVPIMELEEFLKTRDIHQLITRVDYLPTDLSSWKVLINILSNCSEVHLKEAHDFVESYWRLYHTNQLHSTESVLYRNQAFALLGI